MIKPSCGAAADGSWRCNLLQRVNVHLLQQQSSTTSRYCRWTRLALSSSMLDPSPVPWPLGGHVSSVPKFPKITSLFLPLTPQSIRLLIAQSLRAQHYLASVHAISEPLTCGGSAASPCCTPLALDGQHVGRCASFTGAHPRLADQVRARRAAFLFPPCKKPALASVFLQSLQKRQACCLQSI